MVKANKGRYIRLQTSWNNRYSFLCIVFLCMLESVES